MRKIVFVVGLLAAASCKPKPTAADVCSRVEAGGMGTGCRAEKPGGIGGGAVEKMVFDLPSVPGKTGQILRFATEDELAVSAAAFRGMSMFAGPHRFESKRALVFVQLNKDAPAVVGEQMRMLVDDLLFAGDAEAAGQVRHHHRLGDERVERRGGHVAELRQERLPERLGRLG